MHQMTTPSRHRQQGAALFMALIFLLILTVLGVFGMNISRLENMMAGNAQFQTTALNNAEYTLARGVEDILQVAAAGLPFPTSAGYHTVGSIDPSSLVWGFTTMSVTLPDGGTGIYVIANGGTDNDDGEDSSDEGGQKLKEKGEDLKEDMDNLLDEIDSVLEENAEEFVKNYVQRGGE